ncbi:MAG: hypothetical protein Q7P63_01335 [Verrucomicrobiota bacterium JB022]|nr:hypothetical protein [Verrucomicrobiota bacterium JB022]
MRGQRSRPDFLEALFSAFPRNEEDRTALIEAHLKDECVRAAVDYSSLLARFSDNDPRLARFLAKGPEHVNTLLNLSEETEKDSGLEDMLTYLASLIEKTRNPAEADWNIDDEEKAAISAIAHLPHLSARIAHNQLESAASELLKHLKHRLAHADAQTISRTARAIWNDNDFVKIVELALQHDPAKSETTANKKAKRNGLAG